MTLEKIKNASKREDPDFYQQFNTGHNHDDDKPMINPPQTPKMTKRSPNKSTSKERKSYCLIEVRNQKYPVIFEKYNLRIT